MGKSASVLQPRDHLLQDRRPSLFASGMSAREPIYLRRLRTL